jgi:stage II sporulation protein AA (anti-sigma F factor antagonist)
MQTPLGPGAGVAGLAERGRAAFAKTSFGQLTASSACTEPGTLTIGLEGELDIVAAPGLERLLGEVELDRWPRVVLDLRHVSFIDSRGIRVLLGAHRRIGRVGGRVVLRHASPDIRRTLAAIGVDNILDLTDPVDNGRRPSDGRLQPPSAPSPVADLQPGAGATLMAVTNAVVSACKEHTGKGPMRAKAHLRPNALYVVLHDWMTVAERTLLARGRQDLIAESRHHLHEQVADAARASVEDATGRNVIATRSHVQFDRRIAILVFVLSPAA